MKNMMRCLLAGVLFVSLCGSAWSELRMWTDKEGKQIEAEFVRVEGDKVVLKKQEGSELKVSLDNLSPKDHKFAVLQVPPRIKIKVSSDVDRENSGYRVRGRLQVQEESIQCDVEVEKLSSALYEAPLRAELYLMGKLDQKDYYVVLDRSSSKFSFSDENKNRHEFSSPVVNLRQVEGGVLIEGGVEYEGYLALVKDKTGAVISIQCNKSLFEKNVEAIMGAKKNTVLDDDFKLVDPSTIKQRKRQGIKKGQGRPGRKS